VCTTARSFKVTFLTWRSLGSFRLARYELLWIMNHYCVIINNRVGRVAHMVEPEALSLNPSTARKQE
jgi:hypothetical protein